MQTLTTELAGHAPRMYRGALVLLAVGIAWPFLSAVPAPAATPAEGAQPAASTVGDVHAAPPSVLLLPPRLPAGAGDPDRAAAELVCDRLAQDIAAAGLARVVDRTQLDRILQEHNLQAVPSRPMLSYDAMIRLNVDTSRLAPEATLALIDLSTGNMIAERAFAWPPKEAATKPMLDFCREAIKGVAKPAAGKLRVRALWAGDAIPNERMKPLARRLIEVFDQALRRADRVVPVQHLEAATSKEESVLLLMGMSRLPGERQFSPQADATIELRVVEGDGRGKTFLDTPLEIGVRLRKGANYEGNWATTAGLVRDFDALIPQAWRKVAHLLSEVPSGIASTLLDEMTLRRKQAQAEVQTVQDMERATKVGSTVEEKIRISVAALAHAEAAVKLDPTCPDAVRTHIRVLADLSKGYFLAKQWAPDAPLRTLCEASRYVERFRQDGDLCGDLCRNAVFGLMASPLSALCQERMGSSLLQPVAKGSLALTPELVQGLDAAKRLLERGLEDDAMFFFHDANRMTVVVFRGMTLLDVPQAERQAWLEKIAARCIEKVKRVESAGLAGARPVPTSPVPGGPPGESAGRPQTPNSVFVASWVASGDWPLYITVQLRVAELLMEDGRMDRAKQALVSAQAEMSRRHLAKSDYVARLMRALVTKAGDAQLRSQFDRWCQRSENQQASILSPRWPTVDVFAGNGKLDWSNADKARARLNGVVVANCRPLAEGDGRLYVVGGGVKSLIQYIPLDERGRPIGNSVGNPTPAGRNVGDFIKDIPQPKLNGRAWVTTGRYVDGKLCLGTFLSGVQVFDPKTETWKGYGPEQGLPSWDVDALFPIGGHVLYCNSKGVHYMLNLADGAVTLLHPLDENRRQAGFFLRLVWRDGQRVMGMDDVRILADLLGAAPQGTPFADQERYGWPVGGESYGKILAAVEADGRRFCLSHGGLHEVDAAGKPIHTWWTDYRCRLNPMPRMIIIPADCPIPSSPKYLGAAGSRLVVTCGQEWTIYDLKTDTWYGPVSIRGGYAGSMLPPLFTPKGQIWLPYQPSPLTCYSIDDVVAYAKDVGRVITTAEYGRRKQQFIDAAKPLDRGMFNLSLTQFDKAKAAFQQVLDAEPNQLDALLLMGFLHERPVLNKPDEAIKYYRRAAALEDNPVASCSGMFFLACVFMDRQQWKESIDLCEEILQRYPQLERSLRQLILSMRDTSRQQLNK